MALYNASLLTASCPVSTHLLNRDRLVHKLSFSSKQQGCRSCPRRSIQRLQPRAIGFDLGTETGKGEDDVVHSHVHVRLVNGRLKQTLPTLLDRYTGTDKHADNLTRAASSLLLYQNVLKGRPAQAFLKLLLLLQKGRVQDVLEAYGDFYSSLAAGNYLSWQDYLLEEVSV